MNSISISKDAYAAENVRATKATKADADLAVQRARKNRTGAAAAAKGHERMAVAEQVATVRGRGTGVAREAAAKGKDRRRANIAQAVATARQANSDGNSAGEEWTSAGRLKRAA